LFGELGRELHGFGSWAQLAALAALARRAAFTIAAWRTITSGYARFASESWLAAFARQATLAIAARRTITSGYARFASESWLAAFARQATLAIAARRAVPASRPGRSIAAVARSRSRLKRDNATSQAFHGFEDAIYDRGGSL
jgi:hypothetical protein